VGEGVIVGVRVGVEVSVLVGVRLGVGEGVEEGVNDGVIVGAREGVGEVVDVRDLSRAAPSSEITAEVDAPLSPAKALHADSRKKMGSTRRFQDFGFLFKMPATPGLQG